MPKHQDAEWLREQYVENERTTADMADECGVATSTLRHWMDKHDIQRRGSSEAQKAAVGDMDEPYADEDWLREKYVEEGMTADQIADLVDAGRSTIYDWLRRYGIERRDRSEWMSGDRNWQASIDHEDHPLHGTTLPEETKRKISQSLKGMFEGEKNPQFGKTPPEHVREAISEALSGENGYWYGATGEDHPTWKGGYSEDRGTDWRALRSEALQEYDYECQGCGATESEHRSEHGVGLHVHHILPVRLFDEPADADTVDNLVPLCRSCHHRWEGVPLRPT